MGSASDLVSVILSFRNEEVNLPELLRRIAQMADGRPESFEFIFVDDESTDRSHEILLAARAADPRVKILLTARRAGPSEGVLAGLAAGGGDALVYLDCDLQDPPELIPTLIDRWKAGFEVVHTRRTARLGEDPRRMWMTRQAYRVIHWVSRRQMPIESGDFKLLSRRASRHMLSLAEQDPYIRGLAVWIGFPQTFVDYQRQARHSGESKFAGLHRNAVKTLVSGVTSFTFMPIYVILLSGLAGLGLGLGLGLIGLVSLAAGAGGWLALGGLGLALWGALMASIGLVGLYIVRIYKDVRRRPRWLIHKGIGIEPQPDRAVMGAGAPLE